MTATTSTTRLSDTDPVAIKFYQPGRTDALGPLQVDLAEAVSEASVTYAFRISVFLRGRGYINPEADKQVQHGKYATVNVLVGCYTLGSLAIRALPTPTHPNYYSFTAGSPATLKMLFAPTSSGFIHVVDLNTMIEVYSDHPGCSYY